MYAPIAQLDRVLDFESKGCGFDSYLARHLKDNEMIPKIISFLLYLRSFSSFYAFWTDFIKGRKTIEASAC